MLPIAIMLTIWAGVGYYAVIFVAGLQNIPDELYDAARIDGCNDFQKHWHVSLPGLRPQIVFVAVISSLAALKVFDEIYVLTNQTGGVLKSGVTIVFYLWRQAFVLRTPAMRRRSRSRCWRSRLCSRSCWCASSSAGRSRHDRPCVQIKSYVSPDACARPGAGRERLLVRAPVVARARDRVPVPVDAADIDQGARRTRSSPCRRSSCPATRRSTTTARCGTSCPWAASSSTASPWASR